ncbi:MAG TPA: CPXCG motif-containing cysteine-rich protein [Polyangiaceae bacterium]
MSDLTCPHCAEPLETYPDPGGGTLQDYVEDCAVCCRPIRFLVTYDEDAGDYRVDVSGET